MSEETEAFGVKTRSDIPSHEPYLFSATIHGVEEWCICQGDRQITSGSLSDCLAHARKWFSHLCFIRHWDDDADQFGSEFDLIHKD